ncbi:glutamyl-tRNA reductase [Moritella viscosa]|uniref:Glutamyl-tRNA reductase n=1 Tax=Moritella viscosa TaxID=80854 RepID=A0A090IKC1_9GAMM|nr:glutamyl-tRNA reductase [Moritella viscosa]CED61772.1 glutamyl-tRNA reductase [Moritella viscosa]SGY90741.1 Glutamyl-tRNA reductase [Moritella viscosa]SGY94804.1 Glutamyl-tRNA reductase [Moritella viscosa]SGY95196.1 Glutamyl-tRNA reductase [Moritella viscosa]SGY99635.1 Glutamyl-tRNA reductase [Moritella viscosa]
MTLLALGINHNTAPVSLREKVAFSPDNIEEAFASITAEGIASEVVIVSTCNRTEIYCKIEQGQPERVTQWLVDFHQVQTDELAACTYRHYDTDAVRHLMRVAGGLDSLVLGEPQILGQIKQAFAKAKQLNSVAQTLDKLFQKTFTAAKRVRTETEIGANAVSVAFAAVSLSKHIFDDLSKTRVLLIGAGETIDLVATHLADQNVCEMMVANRTLSRAQVLGDKFGASTLTLEEIPQHLHNADIVISSTASPLPIIGKGMIESALKLRKQKPIFLVDIAVPRDIEEEVGELGNAYLYTVDDLQGIIEQNKEARQDAAEQAEQIINEETQLFAEWAASLSSVDSIKEYRNAAMAEKELLLERAIAALQSGTDHERVLTELANKLTNKLIHAPTQALVSAGKRNQDDELLLVRRVVGLD